jgi:DNA-binding response OmpR family regulator
MKILIIGGDKALAHAINYELGEEHYKTRYVPDGDSGLELALKYHFDLIVLAWSTSNTDDLSVMRTLCDLGRRVPILLLAEGKSIKDMNLSLDSGVEDCVSKLTDIQHVTSKIKALVERSKWNKYSVVEIHLDAVAETQEDTALASECIDHKKCQTKCEKDSLWECMAFLYVPCAYRAHFGAVNYCLHKDRIVFSSLSDR